MSNSISIDSISYSTTYSTGYDTNKPAFQSNSERASGTIAAYMHMNNIEVIDANQLSKWTNNADGNTPPEVQLAAKFMLANPGVYSKIEKNDNPDADGISGVHNFDQAALGKLNFGNPTARESGSPEQAQEASGVLNKYMQSKNMDAVDVNGLYALAINKDGNVPEDAQKAALFMLENPSVYVKIETSDVPNIDGISGRWNFEEFSKVKGDSAAQTSDAAGILVGFMDGKYSQLTMDQLKNLAGNKEGNIPPNVQQAAKFMLDNPEIYKKIETAEGYPSDGTVSFEELRKAPEKGDLASKTKYAANVLLGFMDGKYSQLTMDQLKNLAGNKEGNIPPDVRKAAKFMLDNPEIYKKIETAEGYPSDGTVSFEELRKTPIKGDLATQTKDAANVLEGFMDGRKYEQLTMDQLQNMAVNKEGNIPFNVQQAAKFMLDNPEIYKKIETAEGAPSDGTVSLDELRQSQGKV